MSDSGPSDSEAGVVRIATRASRLALWQARHVARLLSRSDPGVVVELVEVSTEGDRDRVARLDAMGGTGVFTREVQQVVLDGRADLAVHSLKDLPTDSVAGLVLAGVPERGDTGDAVVVSQPVEVTEPHRSQFTGLEVLSHGARVGTGSPRRAAQIKHLREDLLLEGIRGNVETRLRKLDEGEYDAVVLAVAGLVRLELSERITAVLDPKRILGAVGGAALGLECREDDRATAGRLEAISHRETWLAVTPALPPLLLVSVSSPQAPKTRIDTPSIRIRCIIHFLVWSDATIGLRPPDPQTTHLRVSRDHSLTQRGSGSEAQG